MKKKLLLILVVAALLITAAVLITACSKIVAPVPSVDTCVSCHTNQTELQQLTVNFPVYEPSLLIKGECWSGALPPLEEWQKVLISDPTYLTSLHGNGIGCVYCHGGDSTATDLTTSHGTNMVKDPSDTCATCHAAASTPNSTNLHTNMNGMITALKKRGGDLTPGSPLATAFQNNCNTCHTTCGQCHVSRGDTFSGGLLVSHNFLATFANVADPATGLSPQDLTCFACHGSRPGPEYYGSNTDAEGTQIAADVHYFNPNNLSQPAMTCTDCHKETEMHGTSTTPANYYSDPNSVNCIDCHKNILTDAVPQHLLHVSNLDTSLNLQCQVCHSVAYKSCYNCHVGMDTVNLPYHTSDPSTMGFKIGINPDKTAQNPWTYVLVRHVPVVADTFAFYGNNLLPDYNAVPAFHTATPHNIQLDTPQNATCNSCHGNAALFLQTSDIPAGDPTADSQVVMTTIPTKIPGQP